MGRGRGTGSNRKHALTRALAQSAGTSTQTVLDDGTQEWRDADGLLHRDDDLPAVISADGRTYKWFKHGKVHRKGGRPAVITPRARQWMEDGVAHREDGPSTEGTDGSYSYKCRGELHRLDGPAVRTKDGVETYWVDGRRLRGASAQSMAAIYAKRQMIEGIEEAQRRRLEAHRERALRDAARPRSVRDAMNRR